MPQSSSTASLDQSLVAMLPPEMRGKTFKAAALFQPPYLLQDSSGKITSGLDIDLFNEFEKRLGIKFQLVDTSFASILPGLQSGRWDLFGGMGDFKARHGSATFVDINKVASGVLAPAKSKKISSLTDLCGGSLGTIAGSIAGDIAANASKACAGLGKPPIKLSVLPDKAALELAMLSGRLDAYTDTNLVTQYTASVSSGKFVSFTLIPNAINGPDNITAIALTKDNKLAPVLVATLKKMVTDGTYQKLYDKYGVGDLTLPIDKIKINGGLN
ncbi:transporter substrate-binding domain-containing protein [Actinomadura scrupuli]|uniref:transporter substrate-binding domain-containing protein n=1 Tax=Actinomadura scrupuli TaxID=559629 RepID=UPI003D985243